MNDKKVKPHIRLARFTDDWERRKLGELGEITTGSTPSTSNSSYYSENGIPWVTPTDINELTGTYIDAQNNNEAILNIAISADDYKSEIFAVLRLSGFDIIKIEIYALSAWQDVTEEFIISESDDFTFYCHDRSSNDFAADYRITLNYMLR